MKMADYGGYGADAGAVSVFPIHFFTCIHPFRTHMDTVHRKRAATKDHRADAEAAAHRTAMAEDVRRRRGATARHVVQADTAAHRIRAHSTRRSR